MSLCYWERAEHTTSILDHLIFKWRLFTRLFRMLQGIWQVLMRYFYSSHILNGQRSQLIVCDVAWWTWHLSARIHATKGSSTHWIIDFVIDKNLKSIFLFFTSSFNIFLLHFYLLVFIFSLFTPYYSRSITIIITFIPLHSLPRNALSNLHSQSSIDNFLILQVCTIVILIS